MRAAGKREPAAARVVDEGAVSGAPGAGRGRAGACFSCLRCSSTRVCHGSLAERARMRGKKARTNPGGAAAGRGRWAGGAASVPGCCGSTPRCETSAYKALGSLSPALETDPPEAA